ncbi:MAG: Hsp20/alpha crystallin family protein [Clostridiaceae bacterium]|nr:Hsp20/alpha crystallin family protein [Clostridiaceae bacterium]
MSLVEWNPFRDMDNFTRDVAGFFDRSPFRLFGMANTPRVDVYQTDNEVIVKAEVPGIKKEDINIFVDENSIRLSGKFTKTSDFKDENVYRSERYYGNFSRTIPLPVEIKTDQTSAEYKDGILTITAMKLEPSRLKGRRIDIN